ISLYEGPSNLLHPIQPSVVTLITKRMAGIVYYPFFAVLLGPSLEGNAHLIVAIVFALLTYGMIHYGMFMKVAEGSSLVADKILKLCRSLFFLAGTLLLLLIIARMGVMLYQDVVYGRFQIGIRAPASK